MNALKMGLSQLSNVQLQRVLDTPEEKLLFSEAIVKDDCYWPMVAGLPAADIANMIRKVKSCIIKFILVANYNPSFNVCPKGYVFALKEAGYNGTMKIVKEIIDERSSVV